MYKTTKENLIIQTDEGKKLKGYCFLTFFSAIMGKIKHQINKIRVLLFFTPKLEKKMNYCLNLIVCSVSWVPPPE